MPLAAWCQTATVPYYHNTADHAGMFEVPGLTAASVGATARDTAFNGAVSGVINAAPLYWRPAGATTGLVIVSTENDIVYALDENTGVPAWQVQLGTAATPTSGCGNINPIGMTGTPVIDTANGVLYVDAAVGGSAGPTHEMFAIALASGTVVPGWPVAIGAGLKALGGDFDDSVEEQRGALALLGGNVFVPYGGYDGDCGTYHGMVVSVAEAGAKVTAMLTTAAKKGGIWAPGGIASDGKALYFATGNTEDATTYAGGEAIVRADPSLSPITGIGSFFSPPNWQTLDTNDFDLGGVSPTLIDLPGSTPSHLALGLGKDGNAYLVNRESLGGIHAALRTLAVTGLYTHTATARYAEGGASMIAFNAQIPLCTGAPEGLVALRVTGGAPPVLASAWCMPLNGRGDPIVTTTDGVDNPIVWVAGAEGDEALHAFDGGSGKALFSAPPLSNIIRHFSTLLVANGKLFVTSDNQVVAYTLAGH